MVIQKVSDTSTLHFIKCKVDVSDTMRPAIRLAAAALLLCCAIAAVPTSVFAAAGPPPARPTTERPGRVAYFAAGVGTFLPWAQVQLGMFVAPRIVVEATAGGYIFNLLTGVGVEVHLLGEGEQPRHALTLGGHLLVNPLRSPSTWANPGAETIGIGGDLLIGWRMLTDGGFLLRINAGALIFRGSSGLEAGPSLLNITAGWAF